MRPIPAPPRRTTGGFSKPSSGGPGRDRPRDLPERFGNRSSVFRRFRRCVFSGVFERVLNALVIAVSMLNSRVPQVNLDNKVVANDIVANRIVGEWP